MPPAAILVAMLLAVAPASAVRAAAADLDRAIGKALFERTWVPAPASTNAADGLGPLFNARSCAACHPRGGPAAFRAGTDGTMPARGLVVRFADAAGTADALYGHQLQDQAVPGLTAEGTFVLHYAAAAQDDPARPVLTLHLDGPPLQPGIRAGLRAAPSLRGRAELARLDARAVLALADPDDVDGDGISGRPRLVGPVGAQRLGRFGWKAAEPDLRAQVATAFALDMGLSSAAAALPRGDCTPAQTDCMRAPTGVRAPDAGGYELAEAIVSLTVAFVESRRAPTARSDGRATALFTAAGCAACHVPALTAPSGEPVIAYTDLLLHDLGADLDDGVGEPGAPSREWRTAPLIDLDPRGGTRRYLHDGRAAAIDAAVRAHGGEAAVARARFIALTADDRAALIHFLEGL